MFAASGVCGGAPTRSALVMGMKWGSSEAAHRDTCVAFIEEYKRGQRVKHLR
jgi:hypothetical protein